jgi:signal transduction histidine kinase
MFALWSIGLGRIVFSTNTIELLFNVVAFAILIAVGFFLVRSVYREIESKERAEVLAEDLEIANRRQEGLIHFISHEVKGALGKGVNVFSMTLDGDYGELPKTMQPLFTQALHDSREAVDMVSSILLSSNLKNGQLKFDMKPIDMREAVTSVADSFKSDAERKGLLLQTHIPIGEYRVVADDDMLRKHIIRNLIDNSIRYTQQGSVTVGLSRHGGNVVLTVEDTGVGISEEDKARLFTEGGRGKDSVKVNVNSTGYGLFFAKQLVDAHKGRIRAESDGPGKGSRFIVELPAV